MCLVEYALKCFYLIRIEHFSSSLRMQINSGQLIIGFCSFETNIIRDVFEMVMWRQMFDILQIRRMIIFRMLVSSSVWIYL